MSSDHGIGLPLRSYIWEGGKGVDVNKDKEIKDIAADPNAVPPKAAVIETTVPWYFAYGEKEWVAGKKFQTVKESAKGDLLAEPSLPPVGRLNCTTGVAL